jgi:hypothetical protein
MDFLDQIGTVNNVEEESSSLVEELLLEEDKIHVCKCCNSKSFKKYEHPKYTEVRWVCLNCLAAYDYLEFERLLK